MAIDKSLIIVTIDGPAASGKTSISREIARRHGWSWVSTGAFYRGLSFVALAENVDLNNESGLVELCRQPFWSVQLTSDQTKVFYKSLDVTAEIYSERVGSAASQVSALKGVRVELLAAQRACAYGKSGLVAEGRDCGTVVFPGAQIKVYVTANSESRAARRASEQGLDLKATAAAQGLRDKQDSTRAVAPMQVPDNAHVVDTSNLSLHEVIDHIDEIVTKELELSV